MSAGILPGGEPAPASLAHLPGLFQGRKVAAFFYDPEGGAGNPVGDLLVTVKGRARILSSAKDQSRAGDQREEGPAVGTAQDRRFLPDESVSPNVLGHFLDSVH